MRTKLIALLTFALLAVACGAGEDGGLASTLNLNDDPESALLIVRDEGGFVPPDFMVRQGPRLILLRDGTLISQGVMIEIFPGPLLIPYQQTQLDDETMLFVLEELDGLGFVNIVDETNNDAANFIADASTTVVTFFNQDGAHRFAVYALGLGSDPLGGVDFTDARVPQLADLVIELENAGLSGSTTPYEPDVIQVLAGIREFPAEPGFADVRPWPLSVSYDAMTATNLTTWRCATYEADEMTALLTEFGQATQETTWEEAGTEYSIAVRPLFAGEEPCAPMVPGA
jgi:hypothetical protein